MRPVPGLDVLAMEARWKSLPCVAGQDVKGSVEDGPLAAAVAAGSVTYVRRVPNEQSMLAAEDCGGGAADGDKGHGEAVPSNASPHHGSIPDDLDCLEVDPF